MSATDQPLHQKPVTPACRRCGRPFDERVPRGGLVRLFLFWLPLKRYICYACKRRAYRLG